MQSSKASEFLTLLTMGLRIKVDLLDIVPVEAQRIVNECIKVKTLLKH